MNFDKTSGAPLVRTLKLVPLLSWICAMTDILLSEELNRYFFIYVMLIPCPLDTRVPSAAYLNFALSKLCFSKGSPTRFPSVLANVWHPPIIVAQILSTEKILSVCITLYFSFYVVPTAVMPLIIKSVWVNVPVLSKQQIFIFPANGILNGSVQKICF
jgi:hypothetical protein